MRSSRNASLDGELHAPPLPPRPADFTWSVVPHTHWDREWYLPLDHFRIRLARVLDEIVDVMETCPEFRRLTLDGQAVILDDYAEIRAPERVERLHKLIRDGRIAVGPSYTLPDEFLSGGESLIRNHLVGREVVRRHGGIPMPVGYMPDPFGHVAQLPQILRGFGLDTFFFWRGLDDRADELGVVFTWEAPDGSQVLAVRQLGGYGTAPQIGAWGRDWADLREQPEAWPAAAADRFNQFLDEFGPEVERAGLTHLLLCNGADHEPIWKPLPELLEHARQAHDGMQVSIDTFAEYAASIRGQVHDLPVVRGELVAGRDAPILRGINSARMYLKQANERTERALRVAETLASLAWLRQGAAYPHDELFTAWKELLKNQPHDSVSGCSIDATHRDMQQRYVTAGAIAERVRREAMAALAGSAAEWVYAPPASAELSLVNPLPQARRALVELPIPDALADEAALHFQTDGAALPVQIRDTDGARRALCALDLPGFGALNATLVAGGAHPDAATRARALDERTIANEHLTVHAESNGTLTVTDAAGIVREGLLVFEDCGDRGDEYNFDEVAGEVPWRSTAEHAEVRVLADGPLVAELEITLHPQLPAALAPTRDARSKTRVELPIRTVVRLVAGIDRIECTTTVQNNMRDHRLRVVFPSPGAREPVRAEGHFAVIHRPARMPWKGSGWVEPPSPTAHTSGAVAAGSVNLLGIGLPEYEAIPTADGVELALTLLRCVGWLSRDDLVVRPRHAGPGVAVPEAQWPGAHTFEYAISVGELTDTELVNASADYRHGFESGPMGIPDGVLMELAGGVGFSALKGSEDRQAAVLRVFNPGAFPVPVALDSALRWERIRLDESEPADGADCLQPGQIGTFRLNRLEGS